MTFDENPLNKAIEYGRYGVKGFIGKNAGNKEALLSILNIKEILKKSTISSFSNNWKGRGYSADAQSKDSSTSNERIKHGENWALPEIVNLAKSLMGKFPLVVEFPNPNTRGAFYPKKTKNPCRRLAL